MYYPINLEVEGQVCVVLGGGHVALRKIVGLLSAGARVIVIAPEACCEIQKLSDLGKVEWRQIKYSAGCLPNATLAIIATNDKEANAAAEEEAAEKNILVNVVDDVDKISANYSLKRFNVPSVIRLDRLMLTISTDGLSPALSKCIRKHLEAQFNENFAKWLEQLSKIRDEVKGKIKNANDREEFWRNVMSNENFSLAQNGEFEKTEVNIRNALSSYRNKSQDFTD